MTIPEFICMHVIPRPHTHTFKDKGAMNLRLSEGYMEKVRGENEKERNSAIIITKLFNVKLFILQTMVYYTASFSFDILPTSSEKYLLMLANCLQLYLDEVIYMEFSCHIILSAIATIIY